jgi:DNA invertase Pin-like site-specific DNA recombinase
MSAKKRAALYVRVSTDQQTVENQTRELRQVAERRGWEVVEVYSDAGISGAKGRANRPGLDQMLKDASRRKFDIAMVWAIDRLGRSLIDLLGTIQHLEACSVDLYLDQQSIDTTTPMGKLVFQVTGAFAEFERSMIKQRVRAGLRRAVAQGKRLGRPKLDGATERKVQRQLQAGKGILATAKALGLGTGTVQRDFRRARLHPSRPTSERTGESRTAAVESFTGDGRWRAWRACLRWRRDPAPRGEATHRRSYADPPAPRRRQAKPATWQSQDNRVHAVRQEALGHFFGLAGNLWGWISCGRLRVAFKSVDAEKQFFGKLCRASFYGEPAGSLPH